MKFNLPQVVLRRRSEGESGCFDTDVKSFHDLFRGKIFNFNYPKGFVPPSSFYFESSSGPGCGSRWCVPLSRIISIWKTNPSVARRPSSRRSVSGGAAVVSRPPLLPSSAACVRSVCGVDMRSDREVCARMFPALLPAGSSAALTLASQRNVAEEHH